MKLEHDFTAPGKVSFRGSLFYSAQSEGKLASMNNTVGVFEHEGDREGNRGNKTLPLIFVPQARRY